MSVSPTHTMAKPNRASIRSLAGLGVEGDAHAGERVRHRYHVRKNPDRPNRCQVHLIHAELHGQLRGAGFDLTPGQMGENVTTRGIAPLGLPPGARRLHGRELFRPVLGELTERFGGPTGHTRAGRGAA